MSLQDSNDLFAPWRGGVGGVRMGLQPIDESTWLRVPADLEQRLAEKRELYARRFDDVVAQLPTAEAACEELAAMLGDVIGFARNPAMSAIANAGLEVADDLCIMQPGNNGYVLTAASLCAPSNWRLFEKLGKPLATIHRPIEQLEERIGASISRFFERLPADRIFLRGNWHLNRSPDLFQLPQGKKRLPAAIGEDDIGRTVWVRTERQTLRRLPESGAVAFLILVEVTPLAELGSRPDLVDEMLAAFESMHPADQRMRHWDYYEQPLRAWRASLPAAASPLK